MLKVLTVDHDQHLKHYRELEKCQRILVYCEAKIPDGKICFKHILRDINSSDQVFCYANVKYCLPHEKWGDVRCQPNISGA